MNDRKTFFFRALIFTAAVLLLTIFIPVGEALWYEVLGISGEVNTGSWITPTESPTPTITPTETPTPTLDPNNCTYSTGYWKNHPEAWPLENVTIGGVIYTQTEALSILNEKTNQDATIILAQQLIATKLNEARGADISVIQNVMSAADQWLVEHPLHSNPTDPDRQTGIDLAASLEAFNNGETGPGMCEDNIIEATETPEPTETLEPTETPEASMTITPTLTLSETVSPTPTLTPDVESNPTQSQTPSETLTPIISSSTATPENEQIESPTPTPEPPLADTPTPTPILPSSTSTNEPTVSLPTPTITNTFNPTSTLPHPTNSPEPTPTPE